MVFKNWFRKEGEEGYREYKHSWFTNSEDIPFTKMKVSLYDVQGNKKVKDLGELH